MENKDIVSGFISTQGHSIVGDQNIIITITHQSNTGNELKDLKNYLDKEKDHKNDLTERIDNTKKRIKRYPKDSDFKRELINVCKERRKIQEKINAFLKEVTKQLDEIIGVQNIVDFLRQENKYCEGCEYKESKTVFGIERTED